MKIRERISNPQTIISGVVFIFTLGVVRAGLNHRLNKLEDFQKSINLVEIQSTLSQIQTDIQRIKNSMK